MRKILLAALMAFLAGCSTTPEQLESDSSTYKESRVYPDNYQALYRKVHGPASRCLAVGVGYSTQFVLDAQLYPDLGFGEMSSSMSSIYGRNFYMTVKIEKAGNGSKMTVSSGNTLVKKQQADRFFSWADGKTSC